MDQRTSEPGRCEVCGDPIRWDNTYGICSGRGKPECARARERKTPRSPKSRRRPDAEVQRCEVCGRPLNRNNQSGICGSYDSPECVKARKRKAREADPRPPQHRIVVNAGDIFGKWTAMEDYSPSRKLVLVRCVCGTEKRVDGKYLNRGVSTSCGCGRKHPRRDKPPYLTAGSVFGRLTVLEDAMYAGGAARCRCECGKEVAPRALQVKRGVTRSCGCLRIETHSTHGFSKHPLYFIWNGILDRCTDPNNASYPGYGGSGIRVCDRWLDPWLFAEDIGHLGPRPDGWSIDRYPDPGGNYEPGNVRWADKRMQRVNQRRVGDLACKLVNALARAEKAETELADQKALPQPRRRRVVVPAETPLF